MSNPNQRIIDALKSIAEVYKAQGVIHKYKAYRTAIETISGLGKPITSVSDVKGQKGIGKAMEEKIAELLSTGELQQQAAVVQDPVNAALKMFSEVHGVGPVLARKLVHDHGLRTMEDLLSTDVQLPPQVRLGLKYHEDSAKRIPYDEIEVHIEFIRKIAAKLDKRLIVECCGSHRRKVPTSGDIDILFTHPESASDSGSTYVYVNVMYKLLSEVGYVLDSLSCGNTKFMGYAKLLNTSGAIVRRLDMRFVPYDCYYSALMYFTGSDLFNIHMREDALKLGYTLNEYGLYEVASQGADVGTAAVSPSKTSARSKGKQIVVNSEEDIFKALKRPFVKPEDRHT